MDLLSDKTSKTKLIFVIQAYESATDTGQLSDVTVLELFSKDYKSALERAKKIIQKKFYRLQSVIEKE